MEDVWLCKRRSEFTSWLRLPGARLWLSAARPHTKSGGAHEAAPADYSAAPTAQPGGCGAALIPWIPLTLSTALCGPTAPGHCLALGLALPIASVCAQPTSRQALCASEMKPSPPPRSAGDRCWKDRRAPFAVLGKQRQQTAHAGMGIRRRQACVPPYCPQMPSLPSTVPLTNRSTNREPGKAPGVSFFIYKGAKREFHLQPKHTGRLRDPRP